LLNDPNVSSPANYEAANMFVSDPDSYVDRVKQSVINSWCDIDRLLANHKV
jgi:ubiquitin-protein ligase